MTSGFRVPRTGERHLRNSSRECLKHDPDDSWGYAFRANTYCGKKNYSQARKDYKKALSFDGSDPYVLGLMAWFLATCPEQKYRDGKRALKLAQTANQLSDDEDLDKLAAAYAQLGDFKNAAKAHKRAMKKTRTPKIFRGCNDSRRTLESGADVMGDGTRVSIE